MRDKINRNTREPQPNRPVNSSSQSDRDVIVRLLAKLLVKKWLKGKHK